MFKPQVPFGAPMRYAYFAFSRDYLPLCHGAFGVSPTPVRAANIEIRAQADEAPDPFILYKTPVLLKNSRELTASIINADPDDIALIPNATTGIDNVLKNIEWQQGDVVVCYEFIYASVGKGLAWLNNIKGIKVVCIQIDWPLSDDQLVDKYISAIKKINHEGNGKERVRLALCDTIVSMPGVRVPFERLIPALRQENVLSILDAAHGIGHIDLDVAKLDPDFMVTNLHKWLYVPRSCAAFYVAKRNQHMIRTTFPTSAGYVAEPGTDVGLDNPIPRNGGSPFQTLFAFTGTVDNTNFMTVPAVKFRTEICGGEIGVQAYCHRIIREAGDSIAKLFETEVLDHPESRIRGCAFANIRLPLTIGTGPDQVRPENISKVQSWLRDTAVAEENMYVQTIHYRGVWWWRISGQIYLELDDYLEGGRRMLRLCERIKNGEMDLEKTKISA